MINLFKKLLKQSENHNYISLAFKKLSKKTGVKQIFEAISNGSELGEIRYVGGCVRKIINKEFVDDIDLAVNLPTDKVCQILNKNQIKFYETGIKHGTLTAIIGDCKFEITSLRKDIETDGRHAKINFSENWLEDASRRDFSINSIYADIDGNLYDPFDGKNNIEKGKIEFIGDAEKRIKEDYLRILRYIRFFLHYSKTKHDTHVIKSIKKNLHGINNLSSERLLDEFKKLARSNFFLKINKDKFCLDLISLIFPQFKNFHLLKEEKKNYIKDLDFIILLALLVNDQTDNVDYFLFKFRLFKKNQKRILFLRDFFLQSINKNTFSKKNLWKILYYNNTQTLLDLLNYQIINSKKDEKRLLELIEFFKDKNPPIMPVHAQKIMGEFNIPEGKELGIKLKKIEERWVNNNFQISDEEVKELALS